MPARPVRQPWKDRKCLEAKKADLTTAREPESWPISSLHQDHVPALETGARPLKQKTLTQRGFGRGCGSCACTTSFRIWREVFIQKWTFASCMPRITLSEAPADHEVDRIRCLRLRRGAAILLTMGQAQMRICSLPSPTCLLVPNSAEGSLGVHVNAGGSDGTDYHAGRTASYLDGVIGRVGKTYRCLCQDASATRSA